jgi:hypothetical protein
MIVWEDSREKQNLVMRQPTWNHETTNLKTKVQQFENDRKEKQSLDPE